MKSRNQILELQDKIKKHSVTVTSDLHTDLQSIFNNCDKRQISPFMKLFWDEQVKSLNMSASQVRYHPMIIKFCLALHAKSSAAYDHLRFNEKEGTGCLILPSKRTLRDYRNYIHPKTGFNPKIVQDLTEKTKMFSNAEKFIVISFDEMKVQEDLVWNKHTGELVGFVDLGDVNLNHAVLNKIDALATHVLVIMIRSIVNQLSFTFATLATSGISSYQFFPVFWRSVGILEGTCGLKVVGATADGASSNRTFFKMHEFYTDGDGEVVYKTPNIFSEDDRFIFFFSDAPHLMKTTRNCLLNSGSSSSSRFLWNSGMHLMWKHIAQFYYTDVDSGLRLIPKISYEHINLTRYSCMNVRLAVQVLSSTMGNVLLEFGPPDAAETAKFCTLMDQFFDCTNVRNTREHIHKRKPFLKPYASVNDERFVWLTEVFLKYFSDWKENITIKYGNLSASEKSKLFISWQTYEVIQMTTYSLIDCVKFLLNSGVDYVLSENFCQDDLENNFGIQRSIGHRKDNPNVQAFLYQDNLIKSTISVAPIGGNVCHGPKKWNNISDAPLPKKRKSKDS